jgi:hypothetical protein
MEMHHKDDYKNSGDSCSLDEPPGRQGKGSGKISTAAKAFRAITAIVVFGVPLVAGTAALLSYGAHKAYKRITDK